MAEVKAKRKFKPKRRPGVIDITSDFKDYDFDDMIPDEGNVTLRAHKSKHLHDIPIQFCTAADHVLVQRNVRIIKCIYIM